MAAEAVVVADSATEAAEVRDIVAKLSGTLTDFEKADLAAVAFLVEAAIEVAEVR